MPIHEPSLLTLSLQYPLPSSSLRSAMSSPFSSIIIAAFMLPLTLVKEAPKQANVADGDGRLPIHWATSSNNVAIVQLLSELRGFDPDVQVGFHL